MVSGKDVTRARFASTAERLAALGDRRVEGLRTRLAELVPLTGEERVLDAGTGTGPIAIALAPLVHSVVGVDLVPAMIEQARKRAAAYPNVELLVGDVLELPFADGAFDLAVSSRTLHHLDRPDHAIRELARVVRAGGLALVVDQVAPEAAAAAALQEEIEQLRDPAHVRTLADHELREYIERARLELELIELESEDRELAEFLDLAGCEGEARAAVLATAERALESEAGRGLDLRRDGEGMRFSTRVGWYLARRPG